MQIQSFRPKIHRLMVVVAVVAILLGGGVRAWRWHQLRESRRSYFFKDVEDLTRDFGDFTKVPLSGCRYLRDVAEPITLVRGPHEAASDHVWMGIVFRDGKQVNKYAEYITISYDPDEIRETLMLGEKRAPARGSDERALLGLLQRWYRRDAEARELHDGLKGSDFPKLTSQQQAKVIGVAILRRLLRRN